jgi:hypothetical protein
VTHSSPYSPAPSDVSSAVETVARPASNPLGVAAVGVAGLMVVLHVVFQFLYLNAIVAGDIAALQLMAPIRTFVSIALAVLTIILGAIALALPGRRKVLAAIALGAGAFALVTLVATALTSFSYATF